MKLNGEFSGSNTTRHQDAATTATSRKARPRPFVLTLERAVQEYTPSSHLRFPLLKVPGAVCYQEFQS
jgi:hypothetical protein